MKTRTTLFGASALLLGAMTVAGTAVRSMSADTGKAEAASSAKAVAEAARAQKALLKRKAGDAVKAAEAAVALDPRNAEYRSLLGQAYLLAGRFTSAGQALHDALALDPGNGRAALNLALAEIGTGDWAGARATLDAHADQIPASDLGLAVALAGDPARGVEILGNAVRQPEANAKTRQNLALAFALAGRWAEATSVAAVDVPGDQLDQRIAQWARFATPANAYDQVAALLGVKAVKDGGQPIALALAGTPTQVAVETAIQPLPEPAPEPKLASTGGVVFAPRREIVQPLPATYKPKPIAPVRAMAAVARPGPKAFYVQLGAFANAGVAKDAWTRLSRRTPALAVHMPRGATVRTGTGTFYRLSVGGFARGEAAALCGTVKARGGACFVRRAAGDRIASWIASKDTQLAAR